VDHDFSKLKRTTVADLKKELADLPDDAPVFTNGYEGGYHDAGSFGAATVRLNVNTVWYYGPHDDAGAVDDAEGTETVNGYVL
jgi:hypothetical protein